MIDKTDELIISALSQNAKQSTSELWDYLREHNRSLSEEEIESRITKLVEDGVSPVSGCSNPGCCFLEKKKYLAKQFA